MKPEVHSVVIVKWDQGYVAHLRFNDHKLDTNLSHYSRPILHSLVDSYLLKKVGLQNASW
jgi:hypothetical protein